MGLIASISDSLRRWTESRRRAVFRFWDGTRTRAIDPMVAYRALRSHPKFDWAVTPKEIDIPNEKISLEALALTAEAVRIAFQLPECSAGGLTEWECVRLLIAFTRWNDAVKKKAAGSRIRPPLTDSPASPATSSETTSTSTDSGSTSDERDLEPAASS